MKTKSTQPVPASTLTIEYTEGKVTGPSGETYPPIGKKRRIRWGWVCGFWFLGVLFYALATSKRVPHEQVKEVAEQAQLLMGIALLPGLVRLYYRRLFS